MPTEPKLKLMIKLPKKNEEIEMRWIMLIIQKVQLMTDSTMKRL